MASERTYTETEARKLAAALDRLARLSHDSYSQVGPKPQAYIDLMAAAKVLRDHAALPAPSPERGPCIPMCRLGSSTHVDGEGVDRCDLCGHPVEQPASNPVESDLGEIRAALEELRINANRLCDRNIGGTYEEDCRRSIARADAALKGAKDPTPATTPGAQRKEDDPIGWALRQCHFIARRRLARRTNQPSAADREMWGHVVRLCEEAGFTSDRGILRSDETSPLHPVGEPK